MKNNLERILYFVMTYIVFANVCFAEEETENINTALKSSGYEPNFFSIVLSLVFVIFLIYITGILYTKLNKVGIKTVKNELKESSDIKPIILSTTPIGRDKTLQVIEIAGEKLLIGNSPNSINLIKILGKVSDYQQPKKIEKEKIIIEPEKVENKIKEEHSVNTEDFGLYKKYLR